MSRSMRMAGRADGMGTFVVTGATSGLGRQVALELAGEGHDVVAVARGAGGQGCVAEDRIRPVAADVSDAGNVDRLAATVGSAFGAIDGLFNAAGIIRKARLSEQEPATFEEVMRTNLTGTVMVTRALLPLLRRPGGSVVNVTSSLLARPVAGVSAYAASKGAVLGFTRAMAIELAGEGIRVNSVSPGLVRSDIFVSAGMSPDDYERYLAERARAYPLGRVGEPTDISAAVTFLLSDRSSWITGADFPVDGGIGVNTAG